MKTVDFYVEVLLVAFTFYVMLFINEQIKLFFQKTSTNDLYFRWSNISIFLMLISVIYCVINV